jgi:hypothetical protein
MSAQFFICAFDNLGFLAFCLLLHGFKLVHNGLQAGRLLAVSSRYVLLGRLDLYLLSQ